MLPNRSLMFLTALIFLFLITIASPAKGLGDVCEQLHQKWPLYMDGSRASFLEYRDFITLTTECKAIMDKDTPDSLSRKVLNCLVKCFLTEEGYAIVIAKDQETRNGSFNSFLRVNTCLRKCSYSIMGVHEEL